MPPAANPVALWKHNTVQCFWWYYTVHKAHDTATTPHVLDEGEGAAQRRLRRAQSTRRRACEAVAVDLQHTQARELRDRVWDRRREAVVAQQQLTATQTSAALYSTAPPRILFLSTSRCIRNTRATRHQSLRELRSPEERLWELAHQLVVVSVQYGQALRLRHVWDRSDEVVVVDVQRSVGPGGVHHSTSRVTQSNNTTHTVPLLYTTIQLKQSRTAAPSIGRVGGVRDRGSDSSRG
jgi:hypothetical protein